MVERREEEDLEKSIVYPKPEDLADLIKEILDTQQKDNDKNSSSPLPGERTENIDGLIINAEIDFKASYSLYKDRIYSSAVYHLQQAIEKLIKACAMKYVGLDYLTIKKTSHNSPEIYLELLLDPKWNNFLRKFVILIPGMDLKPLNALDQTIKNIKRTETKVELARMPTTLLNDLLDVCDNLIAINVKSKSSDFLKEQNEVFFDKYIKLVSASLAPNYANFDGEINRFNLKNFFGGDINFIYDNVNEILVTILPLYLIGLIVYPHESFTRYPGQLMNSQDYSESLGIVQAFLRIWNLGNIILMKVKS